VDAQGNVCVTGESTGVGSGSDYVTIEYSPSGAVLWARRYNGPGNDYDGATAIALDGQGNVYVTGKSYGAGSSADYATIKYSPDGERLWTRRYNGPESFGDFATALALDGQGNVCVTGESIGIGLNADYVTIKYGPSGAVLWARRYNGPANDYDRATALALDGQGNVYVTGESEGAGSAYDYATIKYSATGERLWARRYNGAANDFDRAAALALDGQGNVYVTGYSNGGDSSDDYLTLKYSP